MYSPENHPSPAKYQAALSPNSGMGWQREQPTDLPVARNWHRRSSVKNDRTLVE